MKNSLKNIQFLVQKNKLLGKSVYFSHVFEGSQIPLSGGCSVNKSVAMRKAYAELAERKLCRSIFEDQENNNYRFNDGYSSCGFAFGFDFRRALARAICESLERWAVSQWIDFDFFLDCKIVDLNDSFLLDRLEKTLICKKNFSVSIAGENWSLYLVILVGLSKKGAFLGSRVSNCASDSIEHACLELKRNIVNFDLISKNGVNESKNFVEERVSFFGENRKIAESAIFRRKNKMWPSPKLEKVVLLKSEEFGGYISQALFKDYVPWHFGPVSRFVY